VAEETEETEEEVEEEPVTPKIDRQTRNLLEMNARLRK
jgi:hypothetical protein